VHAGGVLVCSVCTTESDESVEHIESLLARDPDFQLDDVLPVLPEAAAYTRRAGENTVASLPHPRGTDGFFIARFRRTGNV